MDKFLEKFKFPKQTWKEIGYLDSWRNWNCKQNFLTKKLWAQTLEEEVISIRYKLFHSNNKRGNDLMKERNQIFWRKQEKNLCKFGLWNILKKWKAFAIKDKINKLHFLKIKIFCSLKDAIRKLKWNAESWRKYSQTIYLIKELCLEVLENWGY